jgi:hypothetical protein
MEGMARGLGTFIKLNEGKKTKKNSHTHFNILRRNDFPKISIGI